MADRKGELIAFYGEPAVTFQAGVNGLYFVLFNPPLYVKIFLVCRPRVWTKSRTHCGSELVAKSHESPGVYDV